LFSLFLLYQPFQGCCFGCFSCTSLRPVTPISFQLSLQTLHRRPFLFWSFRFFLSSFDISFLPLFYRLFESPSPVLRFSSSRFLFPFGLTFLARQCPSVKPPFPLSFSLSGHLFEPVLTPLTSPLCYWSDLLLSLVLPFYGLRAVQPDFSHSRSSASSCRFPFLPPCSFTSFFIPLLLFSYGSPQKVGSPLRGFRPQGSHPPSYSL